MPGVELRPLTRDELHWALRRPWRMGDVDDVSVYARLAGADSPDDVCVCVCSNRIVAAHMVAAHNAVLLASRPERAH